MTDGLGFDLLDNAFLGLFFGGPDKTTDKPMTNVEPGGSLEVKAMTLNIKNTPPDLRRPQVVAAAQKVSGMFTIGGFQEIVEKEDHADLVTGLGKDYAVTNHGGASESPLAFRKDRYRLKDAGGYVNCVPHLPNRGRALGFDWCDIQNIKSGITMTLVSTHLINAWFDRPYDFPEWRRQMWQEHYAKLSTFVQGKGAKNPTWLFGDFNRHDVPPIPTLKWVVGDGARESGYSSFGMGNTIDKIGLILPRGYASQQTGPSFVLNATPGHDHNARGCQRRIIKTS